MKKNLIVALGLLLVVGFYFWDRSQLEQKAITEAGDGKLFSITADEVIGIIINAPGRDEIILDKIEDEWRLVEPIQERADEMEIASMLEVVLNAKRPNREQEFEYSDEKLNNYGLTPEVALAITFSVTDTEPITLYLGQKVPLGSFRYGTLIGTEEIFLLPAMLYRRIVQRPDDWRDKSELDMD